MNTKIDDKKSLRDLMKKNLKDLVDEKFREENKVFFSKNLKDLFENLLTNEETIIGSFSSLKDEPLFELKTFRTAYPVENSAGHMHYLEGRELTVKKQFGVMLGIPDDGIEKNPNILLIPGLAFDEKGGRLGRGGGFFDRYLEHYQGLKIGVCFDFQILPKEQIVPRLAHDQRVDFLVTQTRIIDCRSFADF